VSVPALFLCAWALGAAAVAGSLAIGDGFLALALVAGMLFLWVAVRLLTDDRVWPHAQTPRLVLGTLVFMLGSGWAFGGLVGLLSALGVEAAETGGS
jgi:hypothetical protein